MKVLVNAFAASSGGALSVLRSLYDFVVNDEAAKEHEWCFLLSEALIEETKHVEIRLVPEYKAWKNRLYFDWFAGRSVIESVKPDVIFSLQNTYTYGCGAPQVLYMHQSIPFQREKKFSFLKREESKLAVYQYLIGFLIKRSIRNAAATIVQTEWIKKQILEQVDVPAETVHAVFPCVRKLPVSAIRNHPEAKLFFYPASDELYKNHQTIVNAVRKLKKQGVEKFKVILTTEGTDTDQIVHLGKISFSEVLHWYSRATLLFPSYIETVGLPLLEAKQLGTLILVADCAYSKEVLRYYENAYYFDPFDSGKLASLMLQVMRKELVAKPSAILPHKKMIGWAPVLEILKRVGREADDADQNNAGDGSIHAVR